jgi:hypothetical protein
VKRAALALPVLAIAIAGLSVLATELSPVYVTLHGGRPFVVRCAAVFGSSRVCSTGTDTIVRMDVDVAGGRVTTRWWDGKAPTECELRDSSGRRQLSIAECCRLIHGNLVDCWR